MAVPPVSRSPVGNSRHGVAHPARGPGAPVAPGEPSVRVALSPEATRLRAHGALVLAALYTNEDAFDRVVRARFDEAGRSEYLASIAQPGDISPEATAERILGGITGYIYGAFRLSRDELGSEDLAEFERGVRKGFERGMREARAILEGLRALDPELARGIDRTESLVREGLDGFFRSEREALAARAPAAGAPRRS